MNHINKNNGIIYYNKGQSCVARMLVSLFSLRKYYTGNITVFLEGPGLEQLAQNIKDLFNVDIIYDNNSNTTTYVRAVEICMRSPYENTIWIDADTLVVDNFDDIFDYIPDNDLVIANFSGWRSSGRRIRNRILSFSNLTDKQTLEKAINYGPAINCGVYGFGKNNKFFEEWLALSKLGEQAKIFIPDEVACQILLPKYKVHILDQKYNVSVKYGEKILDKKIIHFHGRKHCRKCDLAKVWLEQFIKLLKDNYCNISEYINHDRQLKKFMRGAHGFNEYVDKAKEAMIKPINLQKKVIATNTTNKVSDNNLIGYDNTTIVTAIDTKYLEYLKVVLPNWIKYKKINKYPMIVYINGFNKKKYSMLNFLNDYSNIQIIEWDMSNTESQREKMLSSFIFGAAKDVKTKYWLKLDVDLYMNNFNSLIDDSMCSYCLVGHRWGYTKPGLWIQKLDTWAENEKYFQDTSSVFNESLLQNNKYYHKRLQSIVQLHRSDFVRYAADLAGARLPVPSHDTYLWYVASRSALPVKRHNFKKFGGVCHQKSLKNIKTEILKLDTVTI